MSTASRIAAGVIFGLVILCVFGGISYDRMLDQCRARAETTKTEHAEALAVHLAANQAQVQSLDAANGSLAEARQALAEVQEAAGRKARADAEERVRVERRLRDQLDGVRGELRKVTADRDARIKELDEAIVEIRGQHDRMLVKRDRRIESLEGDLSKAREDHAKAMAAKADQIATLEKDAARIQGVADRRSAENRQLKEAYDKLQKSYATSVKAVERLTESLHASRVLIAAQEKAKAEILEQLSAAQKERNDLAKLVDSLREQLKDKDGGS